MDNYTNFKIKTQPNMISVVSTQTQKSYTFIYKSKDAVKHQSLVHPVVMKLKLIMAFGYSKLHKQGIIA